MNARFSELRMEIEVLNRDILRLLSARGALVGEIRTLKEAAGLPLYSPDREDAQLAQLVADNDGPYPNETIQRIFKEIFRASVGLMEAGIEEKLHVSRQHCATDLCVAIGDACIGDARVVIAGPCAIESEEQLEAVACHLEAHGLRFLRAGAYKPRTSPYAFQGLGAEGLAILQRVARRHGLYSVTEVTDTRTVEIVAEHADVLQVGARNMDNYELLREVGRTQRPVLLKRGMAATVDELMWAAEYIVLQGNRNVILCERGIRTFENATRNTLDISAVALLRQRTYLPVVVDVSHAAGRRDILAALARAAFAAGAQGVMVEVHPNPAVARSDSQQQLSLEEFSQFLRAVDFER